MQLRGCYTLNQHHSTKRPHELKTPQPQQTYRLCKKINPSPTNQNKIAENQNNVQLVKVILFTTQFEIISRLFQPYLSEPNCFIDVSQNQMIYLN